MMKMVITFCFGFQSHQYKFPKISAKSQNPAKSDLAFCLLRKNCTYKGRYFQGITISRGNKHRRSKMIIIIIAFVKKIPSFTYFSFTPALNCVNAVYFKTAQTEHVKRSDVFVRLVFAMKRQVRAGYL